MGIEYLIILLSMMRAHFTDVVLIVAVIGLLIYQVRSHRKTHSNTEEAKNACNKMEQYSRISISQNMVTIIKNSTTINRQLDNLVWNLNADRGWLYLFHNSGHDLLGQPFCKITNTNESLTPGTPSMMHCMKEVPIGTLARFIEYLLDNGEVRIPDIETFEDYDRTSYLYFYNIGVKSTYGVLLYTSEIEEHIEPYPKTEDPIGIVGVDYLKEKTEINEEDFKVLYEYSSVIKGLLLERKNKMTEEGN